MTVIQTIEDWMEQTERLRIQYIRDTATMRRRLGRLIEESKRENLWSDPSHDDS